MELAPGTLLQAGKYKIIGKLGQGGFGIAYRAHDQNLKRDVCIKEFFYSDLCERALNSLDVTIITKSAEKLSLVNSFKKKFTKEAQRLAKFQHPNIVQVTDTFEENSTAYFVMEYLQGGSLEDLLSKEGVLNEQKAKELILPLIDALDSIHKTDLLHLDIKPANIMLRNNQTPVLIDFGISKYMELAGGVTTTAPVGISKGYAPLEQYGGSITDFSKATDIYSLCATLYKMVTGITPLEPLQMLSSGLKSPRDLKSQLTTGFNAAIVKGLATKKADRHQSMPQLRLAIGDATATSKTKIETVGETRKTSLPTADEYIQLAEKEFRNKEWRKASENYTGAIIKDEKNDKYYCFRAKCFTEMGDHNKAIDDYSTAIKLNSNNHEALNNRGLSRSRLSYFRDARDDFYTAYNITKNESYFDNWLSVVEKLKDNATLDEYLMHDGSYKDKVYFCRGKIQIEKGNLNEGKADIIKSKELGNYESKEWLKSNSWWGKMNDSSNPSITDKHPKTFWIIFVLSILLIWIISKILNS